MRPSRTRLLRLMVGFAAVLATGSPESRADGGSAAPSASGPGQRVLVLVDETNIDEASRYVETRICEDAAARGYSVADRSAVKWAEVKQNLGGNLGPDTPWAKGIANRFDLLLVGEATSRPGTTPPVIARSGMVSVQAQLRLRLYDVKTWEVLRTVNERGSGVQLEPHAAGEKAFDTAMKGVAKGLFGERPQVVDRASPGAGSPAPAAPVVDTPTVCPELLADLPSRVDTNPDAFAVVIGNRNYRKTKSVDFALNDAALIKTYLVQLLGYREGNIYLVEDATKADFEMYFGAEGKYQGKLYNSVKPGASDVFIYYAGHGAPGLKDQEGYFVPVDADPSYVEIQGFSTRVFYANLAKIPARSTTVVLDACFSGTAILENISPMVLTVKPPAIPVENAVVFSSSRDNQVSSWYNEKKQGLFTYMFAAALHGLAADANHDGAVTIDELKAFVGDNSRGVPYLARRLHNVEQTPTVFDSRKDRVFFRP